MDDRWCLEPTGSNIYMQGITFLNGANNAFHLGRNGQYGAYFALNTFDRWGPGVDGLNSAAIMYKQTYGTNTYKDVVTHNTFTGAYTADGNDHNSCVKAYSWLKGIASNNLFYGNRSRECLAMKASTRQFHLIDNVFEDTTANQKAIGGNWSAGTMSERGYGEIAFNNIKSSSTHVLDLNNDGELDAVYVYRNTFAGPAIGVQNLHASIGPFTFTNNVIINSQAASGSCPAKFSCFDLILTPADYTRLVLTDNLTGVSGDSITDANGALQGSYSTWWKGTRGWELASSNSFRGSGSLRFGGNVRFQ